MIDYINPINANVMVTNFSHMNESVTHTQPSIEKSCVVSVCVVVYTNRYGITYSRN